MEPYAHQPHSFCVWTLWMKAAQSGRRQALLVIQGSSSLSDAVHMMYNMSEPGIDEPNPCVRWSTTPAFINHTLPLEAPVSKVLNYHSSGVFVLAIAVT